VNKLKDSVVDLAMNRRSCRMKRHIARFTLSAGTFST